mmetsp:Transcript_78790/g.255274  ORF Transcript_78790/g.255274 Transcript_78790/m.255274 type:complete len:253 (-) Transcript_78790:1170-1928(-)
MVGRARCRAPGHAPSSQARPHWAKSCATSSPHHLAMLPMTALFTTPKPPNWLRILSFTFSSSAGKKAVAVLTSTSPKAARTDVRPPPVVTSFLKLWASPLGRMIFTGMSSFTAVNCSNTHQTLVRYRGCRQESRSATTRPISRKRLSKILSKSAAPLWLPTAAAPGPPGTPSMRNWLLQKKHTHKYTFPGLKLSFSTHACKAETKSLSLYCHTQDRKWVALLFCPGLTASTKEQPGKPSRGQSRPKPLASEP